MNCQPEIAGVLLDLLNQGILRIRSLAWGKDSEWCAIEADHVHNLPSLLLNYSDERLKYYWKVERVCFLRQMTSDERRLKSLTDFESLWLRLAPLVGEDG
jgi:hypothetical protein